MPFTFAKGHLSLAGSFHSFYYDFVVCQEPSSCRLTVHMDPENLENPQVLGEMMMLQSSQSRHQNCLVCQGFFVRQFVSYWDHPSDILEDLIPFVIILWPGIWLKKMNFVLFSPS